MAQTEKLVRTVLLDHVGTSALTSSRVYPVLLPQQAAFPCVTYQRISGGRIYSLQGYANLQRSRIQVDCWGTSYGDAKNLYYQVKEAMETAGTLKAILITRPDDMYDDDSGIHRVSCDFSVWNA